MPSSLIALSAVLAFSLSASDPRSVSLRQAVAIAERTTTGKVIEAEAQWREGRQAYEVDVVAGANLRRLVISTTGRVERNDRLRLLNIWSHVADRPERRSIARAGRLSEMLTALERRSGGRAVEASFDVEGNRALYEVELVTSIGQTTIYLDAVSGAQVLHVPDE
jgi:uncharacterized membrane protein YkoI